MLDPGAHAAGYVLPPLRGFPDRFAAGLKLDSKLGIHELRGLDDAGQSGSELRKVRP